MPFSVFIVVTNSFLQQLEEDKSHAVCFSAFQLVAHVETGRETLFYVLR